MKLRELIEVIDYDSVGLVTDDVFACGGAAEVWYDEAAAIWETDPELLDLDVCGITHRDDHEDCGFEIEIGLYWDGLDAMEGYRWLTKQERHAPVRKEAVRLPHRLGLINS